MTAVLMRQGDKRPIFGQAFAIPPATITITAGATASLYDAGGVLIINAAIVTGYDAGALTSPRVWYVLDTSTLAPGWYSLRFSVPALGSDGIARMLQIDVNVEVTTAQL